MIGNVGIECKKAGITESVLKKISDGESTCSSKFVLTNEVAKELDEFRRLNDLSCETLVNWICALSLSESIMKVKQSSVWRSVDRMLKKKVN